MALLLLLLFLMLVTCIQGHYNLRRPTPYHAKECHAKFCPGPCPRLQADEPTEPSALWRRGEVVDIQWHKNNHRDGFYRRSLLPVSHMYEWPAHDATAFDWGCWSQNVFQCGSSADCGSDKAGRAYQNAMTVPDNLPDGDYVFGMVWFGGTHWKQRHGFFSNFKSCAFIRIQGGRKLANSYTATFSQGIPDDDDDDLPPGTCMSASTFVAECNGRPCERKVRNAVPPAAFANGPPIVQQQTVRELMGIPDATADVISEANEHIIQDVGVDRHRQNAPTPTYMPKWSESYSYDMEQEQQQSSSPTSTPIPSTQPTAPSSASISLESQKSPISSQTASPELPISKLDNMWTRNATSTWWVQCGMWLPCHMYCDSHANLCIRALQQMNLAITS